MQKITLIICGSAMLALTGCFVNTETERGLVGAATGAVVASTAGGNVVAGAVVGGAAGVLCDDVGICR